MMAEVACGIARALQSTGLVQVKCRLESRRTAAAKDSAKALSDNLAGESPRSPFYLLESLVALDEWIPAAEQARVLAHEVLLARSEAEPLLDDVAGFSGEPVYVAVRYAGAVREWAIMQMQRHMRNRDLLQRLTDVRTGLRPTIPDELLVYWGPALNGVSTLKRCPPEMTELEWGRVHARLERLHVSSKRPVPAQAPLSRREQAVWDALEGKQLTAKEVGRVLDIPADQVPALVKSIRGKLGEKSIRNAHGSGYWRDDAAPQIIKDSTRQLKPT